MWSVKAGGYSGQVNGGSARVPPSAARVVFPRKLPDLFSLSLLLWVPSCSIAGDKATKQLRLLRKNKQKKKKEKKSMLSVLRVHLPSDIPIVGCELTPYLLLRRPDKTITTDDVPESAPLEGHFLRYKW